MLRDRTLGRCSSSELFDCLFPFRLTSMSESCFEQNEQQISQEEEKLEAEAVNMIIERLIDLKPSLYWHYTREVG